MRHTDRRRIRARMVAGTHVKQDAAPPSGICLGSSRRGICVWWGSAPPSRTACPPQSVCSSSDAATVHTEE